LLFGEEDDDGTIYTPTHLHTHSAYEALQLFSSQAQRKIKEGDVKGGIGIALEGMYIHTHTHTNTHTKIFTHTHIHTHTCTGATALIDQGYPACGLELGTVIVKIGQDEAEAPYDLVRIKTHTHAYIYIYV
jgi:hypothetical protein